MKIALASPPIPTSLDDGLAHVRAMTEEAAGGGARVVCFPEAYLPGLRGQGFAVADFTSRDEERTIQALRQVARDHRITMIAGIEHIVDDGRQIAALVIDAAGDVIGMQTKNQIDPTEEPNYIPGTTRRVFTIEGLTFGVAICHEGWRYPETVRWAATRGAHIVFHPQLTGSDSSGPTLTTWGAIDNPYYEKAMLMRSRENTIYFASVNYGVRFQESATTLVAPSGEMQAFLPYGRPGILMQELDLGSATGFLARRFAPERYVED